MVSVLTSEKIIWEQVLSTFYLLDNPYITVILIFNKILINSYRMIPAS